MPRTASRKWAARRKAKISPPASGRASMTRSNKKFTMSHAPKGTLFVKGILNERR